MTQKRKPRRRLALSVRQPFAELILRGQKITEMRSRSTRVRGRIYIYATMSRHSASVEAEWAEKYGIDIKDAVRGAIIGSVELWNCTGADGAYEWHLRRPKRLRVPRRIARRPNPVWFYP